MERLGRMSDHDLVGHQLAAALEVTFPALLRAGAPRQREDEALVPLSARGTYLSLAGDNAWYLLNGSVSRRCER